MKRTLAILLAILMVATMFAGCGSSEAPAATEAPKAEAPATEAATEAADPYADVEPVTFNIATSYKEGSDYINTLQAACDTIAEKTNGKVNFTIYTNNQLGSVSDCMEMMLNGANVMPGFGMGNLSSYVKEGAIPSYPYVVNNYDELSNLFNSNWWAEIKDRLINEWNMVPIMCFSVGYRNAIGAVPVTCADDLKGNIYRIGMGTVGQDYVTACGGTPTTTSAFSDCYSALQTKMFELCEADCELLYNSALYEVADYLSVTHHATNPCVFAVHSDYWNKIPAEYQEIVLEELDKAGSEIWNTYSVKENEWIQKFAEAGTTVIYTEEVDIDSFKAKIPDIMEAQGISGEEYEKVAAAIAGNG